MLSRPGPGPGPGPVSLHFPALKVAYFARDVSSWGTQGKRSSRTLPGASPALDPAFVPAPGRRGPPLIWPRSPLQLPGVCSLGLRQGRVGEAGGVPRARGLPSNLTLGRSRAARSPRIGARRGRRGGDGLKTVALAPRVLSRREFRSARVGAGEFSRRSGTRGPGGAGHGGRGIRRRGRCGSPCATAAPHFGNGAPAGRGTGSAVLELVCSAIWDLWAGWVPTAFSRGPRAADLRIGAPSGSAEPNLPGPRALRARLHPLRDLNSESRGW